MCESEWKREKWAKWNRILNAVRAAAGVPIVPKNENPYWEQTSRVKAAEKGELNAAE